MSHKHTCQICKRKIDDAVAIAHIKAEEYIIELIRKDHPEWDTSKGTCDLCVEYYKELIKQTIGWIVELQQLDKDAFSRAINEKIHAKMACVAAVKAGDSLTIQQMQELIRDLNKTENRLTCPHGRPTGWLLPKHEIEKKFKRDYRGNIANQE